MSGSALSQMPFPFHSTPFDSWLKSKHGGRHYMGTLRSTLTSTGSVTDQLFGTLGAPSAGAGAGDSAVGPSGGLPVARHPVTSRGRNRQSAERFRPRRRRRAIQNTRSVTADHPGPSSRRATALWGGHVCLRQS